MTSKFLVTSVSILILEQFHFNIRLTFEIALLENTETYICWNKILM